MRMKKQIDGFLSNNIYEIFLESEAKVSSFLEGDDTDRMALLKKRTNHHVLHEIKQYCTYVPQIDVEYSVKPIAQTILKIDLILTPNWFFNPKWHLKSEIFWILFDDG